MNAGTRAARTLLLCKMFGVKRSKQGVGEHTCKVPMVLDVSFRTVKAADANAFSACTYVPGIPFDA